MTEPEPSSPSERRRQGLRKTGARAGAVAFAAIRVIRATRRIVWGLAQVLLALIVIFEEWGWRPLAALLGRLAKLATVARIEALVASLPPYPALAVFALPSLLLLPIKLFSFWLIAGGHLVSAGVLFIGAKLVGTALVARIFMLTRPALMQLGWFARAYYTFTPWKEALFAGIRQSWAWRYGRLLKVRIKGAVRATWLRWKPAVEPLIARAKALLRRS